MKPALSCCVPHSAPSPSGWAWVHSSRCPLFARQKVSPQTSELRLIVPAPETDEVAPAPHPHPRCAKSFLLGTDCCSRCAPLLHPPTCACEPCRYANEHSDDEHTMEEATHER